MTAAVGDAVLVRSVEGGAAAGAVVGQPWLEPGIVVVAVKTLLQIQQINK